MERDCFPEVFLNARRDSRVSSGKDKARIGERERERENKALRNGRINYAFDYDSSTNVYVSPSVYLDVTELYTVFFSLSFREMCSFGRWS